MPPPFAGPAADYSRSASRSLCQAVPPAASLTGREASTPGLLHSAELACSLHELACMDAARPKPRPALHWPMLGLLLLATACGGSGGDQELAGTDSGTNNSANPPQLEIGQGELEFAPLADDEGLPYFAGSQGGHHVFVGFRVQHLNPVRVHVAVTTRVSQRPELDLTREGRVNFAPADTTTPSHVFAGWPAQILMAPCLVGESVHIDVTLTDLDMQRARDTRTIRIIKPDSGSAADCPTAR